MAGLIDGDFHHLSSECAGGREAREVDGLNVILIVRLDRESDVQTAVKLRGG